MESVLQQVATAAQFNDLISLSLNTLNLGTASNEQNFVNEFRTKILDSDMVAHLVFSHLQAIEVGTKFNSNLKK